MAEEEKNETEETSGDSASPADASQPADPGSEAEESAVDGEAEAPDVPADGEAEAPEAEETPAEETPEAEAADDAPAEEAPAADESLEGLDWKARMRLERSRRPAEAGPQRTPEERAAERAGRRAAAGKARSSYRRKSREGHETGEGTPPAERRSAGRKVRQGTVVSNKADKTITVRIDVARRHTTYEKIVRHSNTLHAHDEGNEAAEGDLVRVVETRPLSRTKRWRLVEILEKAK
jgi:small subunit ribosomal protein S17